MQKKLCEGDYGPSGLPLELSSHPNRGIVRMDNFFHKTPRFPLELSSHPDRGILQKDNFLHKTSRKVNPAVIGPKEGAIYAVKEGNFLRCTGHDEILQSYHSIMPGMPIAFGTADEESKKKAEWIIRHDGKISPSKAPHLCLGSISYPMLILVERDSQNRVFFENSVELKDSQDIKGEFQKGVSLKLKSSQNIGVVVSEDVPVIDITFISVAFLYLGPADDSLLVRFTENQEILLEKFNGFVFRAAFDSLESGNVVQASKDNCDHPRLGTKFQVNEDGSMSPSEALHLSLGFSEIGNSIVFPTSS